MIGIEPTWIAPLDPKSSASASFATSADFPHQKQIGGAKIGILQINPSHKTILICIFFVFRLFNTYLAFVVSLTCTFCTLFGYSNHYLLTLNTKNKFYATTNRQIKSTGFNRRTGI